MRIEAKQSVDVEITEEEQKRIVLDFLKKEFDLTEEMYIENDKICYYMDEYYGERIVGDVKENDEIILQVIKLISEI